MSPSPLARYAKPSAVERISKKFGGGAALATVCGVSRAAVSWWNTPLSKNGGGGIIPAKYHAAILAAAKKRRVRVRPGDLVNV